MGTELARGWVHWAGEVLRDALNPRVKRCWICGGSTPSWGVALCAGCLRLFPFICRPYCAICGTPLPREEGKWTKGAEVFCQRCQGEESHRKIRSLLIYEGVVREHLLAFKYRQETRAGEGLAELMAAGLEAYPELWKVDGVAPVPLTPEKFRSRGFNQAEVFADKISGYLHRPCLTRVLVRKREAPPQASLGRRDRKTNLAGVFGVNEPAAVRGLRILLVDDVFTTGATAGAAAHVLERAGTREVLTYTLARSVKIFGDGEGEHAT